ncbi:MULTISPECIES: aldo/keto reductase [unclassified Nocardioides]|uniref:aldo/keto reductase n=1 Tax=unclassified Nocardioides TaxID=2615069 RepID=UPI0006FB9699|nr:MULTISPECIES: aldo/keto reductase [unclassified Nocardioides]KQY62450.1 2,5-diketo-D-gluconic acid reductase [Nocardioides sp. Root140]KRF16902.1 2,5-diketo-D-gluconic acid reductase [Nocardioides sp. Soil796]
MSDIPSLTLNDGTTLPAIGFGTYTLTGSDGVDAIRSALDTGYRLLDTAVNYGNEEEVGRAVRESGLPRDEVLITSKLPGRHHAYDDAVASTKESLGRLGVDHLDLHLIHWPNPTVDKYADAWRALVDLQQQGLVRSIGVSNFTADNLNRIIAETGVTPAVNQVELHPWFPQVEMRVANEARGIVTSSWSPLGKRNAPFDEAPVRDAAESHNVTPAQVVLRWQVQIGALPIPKSATPQRQQENLAVFDFVLTDDEVAAITALGRPDGRLFGGDPETHEEM